MNIILFGFKGCGKTYFGKRLSALLKRPFIDTDDLLINLYKKRYGEPILISKIYQILGNKDFRELEKESVLQLHADDHAVIALGGGAILERANYDHLQKIGRLVYLQMQFETALKRAWHTHLPAYVDHQNPIQSFHEIYEERRPMYQTIPAPCIDVDLLNEQEVLSMLIRISQSENYCNGV